MNGWSVAREPEKPKTITGKRAAAVLVGENAYVRLMRQAEACEGIFGRQSDITAALYDGARAIRELVDLMPGEARANRVVSDEL